MIEPGAAGTRHGHPEDQFQLVDYGCVLCLSSNPSSGPHTLGDRFALSRDLENIVPRLSIEKSGGQVAGLLGALEPVFGLVLVARH